MNFNRSFFKAYPCFVFIPLWLIWLGCNFIGPGAWIGPTMLKQLLSGPRSDLNIIFPVTWISAVSSFILITFFLKRETSIFNVIPIAAASQFGSAFLFEFVFSFIALYRYGHPILEGNSCYIFIGFVWLIMPLSGIVFWSKNKFVFISIGVFSFGFLIWILIGFPILEGILSLILNYITKIASFATVSSLYYKGK